MGQRKKKPKEFMTAAEYELKYPGKTFLEYLAAKREHDDRKKKRK